MSIPPPEPGVLTEVPDSLKRLAKYVMHGFYSVEHALIVDLLVRNNMMKEDDLADLLKFDKKQLRTLLMKIKSDKLLRQVMRVETQADGRTERHYYYYINYKTFVNVVRFKLDHMRQKIERRERDSTCKALFKCKGEGCSMTYNEFDAGSLYNPMTMEMRCTYCGAEVQEDESVVPKMDAVTTMVKFNEQMKPIFELLKDVENIKLAQDLLEPTPNPNSEYKNRSNERGVNVGGPQHGWREGNRGAADLYHQDVTINIGENQGTTENQPAPKERPVWMVESTVEGAIVEGLPSGSGGVTIETEQDRHALGKSNDGEIMRALLAHERKVGQRPNYQQHHEPNSDNESDASASDDDFPAARPTEHMLSEDHLAFGTDLGNVGFGSRLHEEEEEEEEEEMMVTVNGRPVALDEVTPDLIAQMNPHEKEEYIRLAQMAHSEMYD